MKEDPQQEPNQQIKVELPSSNGQFYATSAPVQLQSQSVMDEIRPNDEGHATDITGKRVREPVAKHEAVMQHIKNDELPVVHDTAPSPKRARVNEGSSDIGSNGDGIRVSNEVDMQAEKEDELQTNNADDTQISNADDIQTSNADDVQTNNPHERQAAVGGHTTTAPAPNTNAEADARPPIDADEMCARYVLSIGQKRPMVAICRYCMTSLTPGRSGVVAAYHEPFDMNAIEKHVSEEHGSLWAVMKSRSVVWNKENVNDEMQKRKEEIENFMVDDFITDMSELLGESKKRKWGVEERRRIAEKVEWCIEPRRSADKEQHYWMCFCVKEVIKIVRNNNKRKGKLWKELRRLYLAWGNDMSMNDAKRFTQGVYSLAKDRHRDYKSWGGN